MFVGKNFRLHQEALKEILNIITFYNIYGLEVTIL